MTPEHFSWAYNWAMFISAVFLLAFALFYRFGVKK